MVSHRLLIGWGDGKSRGRSGSSTCNDVVTQLSLWDVVEDWEWIKKH